MFLKRPPGNRLASRSWQTFIRSSDGALYWHIYASLAAMSFREYYHILCHFTLVLCRYLLKIHRFLQCMRPPMLWFILVPIVLYIRGVGVTWLCNICCIYISLYLIIIGVCWLGNVRRRRRATPYFFNIKLPHTDDFVTRQLFLYHTVSYGGLNISSVWHNNSIPISYGWLTNSSVWHSHSCYLLRRTRHLICMT